MNLTFLKKTFPFLFFLFLFGWGSASIIVDAAIYAGGSDDGYDMVKFTQDMAEVRFTSAANQTMQVGDAATDIVAITFTVDTGRLTVDNDIYITIPDTLYMEWDQADTTAVVGVIGTGAVSSTVTFLNAKTLILDVTTPLEEGDVLSVSGLSFASFTSSSSGRLTLAIKGSETISETDAYRKFIGITGRSTGFAGGSDDGYDMVNFTQDDAEVSFTSAADQSVTVGDGATDIAAITFTVDTGRLTVDNDIYITIPDTLYMEWNQADIDAVVGVNGTGAVSSTVTFLNAKTLILDVTTPLEEGDVLSVSGLSFASFTSSSSGRLTLTIKGSETISETDAYRKFIGITGRSTGFAGGSDDGYDMVNFTQDDAEVSFTSAADQSMQVGDGATDMTAITFTVDTGRLTVDNDIYITIPDTLYMEWDTSDTQAVVPVTGAAGAVSSTVTFLNAKTLILDVTTALEEGAVLSVSGLSFESFTSSSSGRLTLAIKGSETIAETDAYRKFIGIAGRSSGFAGGSDDGYDMGNFTQDDAEVSFTSAADQTMDVGDGATLIEEISITVGAGRLTEDNDIYITIPDTLYMEWDQADTTAVVGVIGTGAVFSTVTFLNAKTLILDVTTPLEEGAVLSVSGLSFESFTSSSSGRLTLTIKGSETISETDAYRKFIGITGRSTGFAGGSDDGYDMVKFTQDDAEVRFTSAANQTMQVGDAATDIVAITFTVDTGRLTVDNDIYITIPDTLYMEWDQADTTAVVGVIGTGAVSSTVTFLNSKTLILDVITALEEGAVLSVSGLSFESFTSSSSGRLTLAIKGSETIAETDAYRKFIGIAGRSSGFAGGSDDGYDMGNFTQDDAEVSFTSAANQSVTVGDAATEIDPITVTIDAGRLTVDNDIYITIPDTLYMEWDQADTTAVVGVIGTGAVSSTVTFLNSKTLILDVTTALEVGDVLSVSGLSFASFTSSSSGRLTLSVKDNETIAETDYYRKFIDTAERSIGFTGGEDDGYDMADFMLDSAEVSFTSAANQSVTVGDGATVIDPITVTIDSGRLTVDNDIYITIPDTLYMEWNQADTTAVVGVTGTGAVSTTVSYANPKTLVLNVTASLERGAVLSVSGLSFASFTSSSSGRLTLSVKDNETITETDYYRKFIDTAERSVGFTGGSDDGYDMADFTLGSAEVSFTSAANQSVTVGDAETEIDPITVTIDAGRLTVDNDIYISIPDTLYMEWDQTDSDAVVGVTGTGAVSSMVTFLNSKTLILDVTTALEVGDVLSVSGLSFASFTASSSGRLTLSVKDNETIAETDYYRKFIDTAERSIGFTGGEDDGYDMADFTLGSAEVSFTSAANQSVTVGDAATEIDPITVIIDAGRLTVDNDIYISIPDTLYMEWDQTDSDAVVGVTGTGAVSSMVTFLNSKTLILDVTTALEVGDVLSVSGLSFASFTASSSGRLTLSVKDNETITETDYYRKFIDTAERSVGFTGGSDDGYDMADFTLGSAEVSFTSAANQSVTVGDAETEIDPITVTIDAGRLTVDNDIYISIPDTLYMEWDQTDSDAVVGVTGTGAVSSMVTFLNSKTLILDVTTALEVGDVLSVSGLSFASFTASSSGRLTLSVKDNETIAETDYYRKFIDTAERSIGFTGGEDDGYDMADFTLGSAEVSFTSAANQSVTVGDAATEIDPITVIIDAGRLTVDNDIYISIPDTLYMEWDQTDSDAVVGVTGTGAVSSMVTFLNSKTLILDVTTALEVGDVLSVSGLSFASFTASSSGRLTLSVKDNETIAETDYYRKFIDTAERSIGFTGGSDDGYDMSEDSAGTPVLSFTSAADQYFYTSGDSTLCEPITITKTLGDIDVDDVIYFTLPDTLYMVWDDTVMSANFSSPTSGDFTAEVEYRDSAKTLVVRAGVALPDEGTLTLSGLKFKDFMTSSSGRITLSMPRYSSVSDTDAYRKFIDTAERSMGFTGGEDDGYDMFAAIIGASALSFTSSVDQNFIMGQANAEANALTVTVTAAEISAGEALHFTIPQDLGMSWYALDTDASIYISEVESPLSVSFTDADKTLVVHSPQPFSGGSSFRIEGVTLTGFTSSGSGRITLNVPSDETIFDIDDYRKFIDAPERSIGFTGGEDDGYDMNENAGGTWVVQFSSDKSQMFEAGGVAQEARPFRIEQISGNISADEFIYITIPDELDMFWDDTFVDGTIYEGGSLVNSAVTYSPDGKSLILDVLTPFSDGEIFSVGGFVLKDFTLPDGVLTETGVLNLTLATDPTVSFSDRQGKTISRLTGITKYYISTDGDFDSDNNWSTTSGGEANTIAPVEGDTAIFDALSGICRLDADAVFDNMSLASDYTAEFLSEGFAINLEADLSVYGGRMDLSSSVVMISGNMFVTADAVFEAGTSSITFEGDEAQELSSSAKDFYHVIVTNKASSGMLFSGGFTTQKLIAQSGGSRLIFKAGENFTIDDGIYLGGNSSEGMVSLESSLAGIPFEFTINQDYSFEYLKVTDSEVTGALGGLTGITVSNYVNAGGNDDAEDVPHWIFTGPVVRYWVGAIDGDWHDLGNWSTTSGGPGGAGAPDADDTVIFDGGSDADCTLEANVVVGDWNMIADYSGQIMLGTYQLSVMGDLLQTGGTISAASASAFDIGGALSVSESAIFIAPGATLSVDDSLYLGPDISWTASSGTVLLTAGDSDNALSVNHNVFSNVTFNNASGGWTLADDFSVTGTLHIESTNAVNGLILNGEKLYVHDVLLSAGRITAGASTITLDGDWTNTGGVFLEGTSTLVLNGTTQLTSHSQSFYKLEIGTQDAGGPFSLELLDNLGMEQDFYIYDGGATNFVMSDYVLSVGGDVDWEALDTLAYANSEMVLNGTGVQRISLADQTIHNLTLTNVSGEDISFSTGWRAQDVTCEQPGASLRFAGGESYTVAGTLNMQGLVDNLISLNTIDDALPRFTFDVISADQLVSGVSVAHSQVSSDAGYSIRASLSLNGGNNDESEPAPHWIFTDGEICRWTDATGDHSWTTAGNWENSDIPDEIDEIAFFDATSSDVTVTGLDLSIAGLQVLRSFGGTIRPAVGISLVGDLTLNGGTLDLETHVAPLSIGRSFMISDGATFRGGQGVVHVTGSDATYAASRVDKDRTFWPATSVLVIETDENQTLPSGETYGALSLQRLTPGGTTVFTMGSTITGDWTIGAETEVHMSADMDIAGNVNISGALYTHGYDLNIDGALTLPGTLDATDDIEVDTTIYLAANADFTGGALTVGDAIFIFDGDTELISDGKVFYDIQVGSATTGGALKIKDNLQINNRIISSGVGTTELDITGQAVSVNGDVDVSEFSVMTSSDSTVILAGNSAQRVLSGSKTFGEMRVVNTSDEGVLFSDAWEASTFRATQDSSVLTFHAGEDYAVTSNFYLGGSVAGNEVELKSDTPGSSFSFVVSQDYSFSFVDVSDSQVNSLLGGVNGVAVSNYINGGGNDDEDAAPHWIFTGVVARYWVASSSADWSSAANWSVTSGGAGGAGVPGPSDVVVFDANGLGSCYLPAAISVGSLQLTSGYTGVLTPEAVSVTVSGNIDLSGGTLDLETNNAPLSVGGRFIVSGDASFKAGTGMVSIFGVGGTYASSDVDKDRTSWPQDSLLMIASDADQVFPAHEQYGTLWLKSFTPAGKTAYTMGSVISGDWTISSGATVDMADDMDIAGHVVISGALYTHGYDLDIEGTLIVPGTLNAIDDIAPDTTISLVSDADFTGGTLIAGDGVFVFNGDTDLISDAQSFYDIQIGGASGGGILRAMDSLDVDNSLYASDAGATIFNISDQMLSMGGDMDCRALDIFTISSLSTVVFDGSSNLYSSGKTFPDIRIGRALAGGMVSVKDNLLINGSFYADLGATTGLDMDSVSITINGDVDLQTLDSFTSSDSSLILNGTSAQVCASTGFSYSTIKVQNSTDAGVSFANGFTTDTFEALSLDGAIYFAANEVFKINDVLNIRGAAIGSEVWLDRYGGAASDRFILDVQQPTKAAVYLTHVANSEVISNNLEAYLSRSIKNNDDGEPTPHWIFSAEPISLYWVGSSFGAWHEANNWSNVSGGAAGFGPPEIYHRAVFDVSDTDSCRLTADVEIAEIFFENGYTGTLETNDFDVTIQGQTASFSSGTLLVSSLTDLSMPASGARLLIDNNGWVDLMDASTVVLGSVLATGGRLDAPENVMTVSGNFTIDGAQFEHDEGTLIFSGNVHIDSDDSLYDVRLGTASASAVVGLLSDVTIDGDLSIGSFAGSTVDITNRSIYLKGDVDLTHLATLASTDSNLYFQGIAGQSFTAAGRGLNNVIITNTSSSGVKFQDALTLNDLNVTTGGVSLFFKEGQEYVINGALNLDGGALGDEIILNSSDDSSRFSLRVASSANVSFVDVSNSEVTNPPATSPAGNILADDSIFGGNTDINEPEPHWYFARNLKGKVYQDQGFLPARDGLRVALSINGGVAVTTTTALDGSFSFNEFIEEGDLLAFYLDGETDKASFVTRSDYDDIENLSLYFNTFIVGNDESDGTTTTQNLKDAHNADTDLLYIVNGSDDLAISSAVDFLIQSGVTFVLAEDLHLSGNFINRGSLMASSGNELTLSGSWNNLGAFSSNGASVIFDGAQSVVISGNTTFDDIKCSVGGKTISFAAGSTQTISGDFSFSGLPGNPLVLHSDTDGVAWNVNFSTDQQVTFVDLKDSHATGSPGLAANSLNKGNNQNWFFYELYFIAPENGVTVGRTPTLLGTGGATQIIDIYGMSSGSQMKIASTLSDTNGMFRVDQHDYIVPLDLGANQVTARFQTIEGAPASLTVAEGPAAHQTPIITSPASGERLNEGLHVTGEASPGASVYLYARDKDRNLPIVLLGSVLADDTGKFVFTRDDLSEPMPPGEVDVHVRAAGANSDVLRFSTSDPSGIIFDATTNEPIEGARVSLYKADGTLAVAGVDLLSEDTNPYVTTANGIYAFTANAGDYYFKVDSVGYRAPSGKASFPDGRVVTIGSLGETFTIGTSAHLIDIPADASGDLFEVHMSSNKASVHYGDIVTYTITIENTTGVPTGEVALDNTLPPGFKYLSGKILLDGFSIDDPVQGRNLVVNLGSFSETTKKTLRYQLVVGSGVSEGKYDNTAFVRYISSGRRISNMASKTVSVVKDALFDLSTIIGRVFWDLNQDGRFTKEDEALLKDKQLPSLKGVQIVTERGLRISVDENGLFHVPGMQEGRHVFRLDEGTLSSGVKLTTGKAILLDVRPGFMQKVNFGVCPKDMVDGLASLKEKQVKIFKDVSLPQPRLNVSLLNAQLYVQDDSLQELAEFGMFTNYPFHIKKWRLIISDQDTGESFRVFTGEAKTLFKPIYWDGKSDKGLILIPGRKYGYRLAVEDAKGDQDSTKIYPIEVVFDKAHVSLQIEDYFAKREAWLVNLSHDDSTGHQSIVIDGETVRMQMDKQDAYLFSVQRDQGSLEIPVRYKKLEFGASDVREGRQEFDGIVADVILPRGQYQIVPSSREILADGDIVSIGDYVPEHVQIGDDFLFFVGLADVTMGLADNDGHIEPLERSDDFHDGFYVDKKVAFAVKGKIKGKYLIEASYDTERDKEQMLNSLDPESYYPLYGDTSSVDLSSDATQGPLYLLMKWDKSLVKWGDYSIDLSDTELAKYNRTLYGGMMDYQSVASTLYGESMTKALIFQSRTTQRTGHNEFLSTGGSAYYLKNRDLITGSENLKVEVRDRITGQVIKTRVLEKEIDYEISGDNGRIVLSNPLEWAIEDGTIISNGVLVGNPVYLIVDYQYASEDKYDEMTRGVRFDQALDDYTRVGVTYIEEAQEEKDYSLQGVDVTFHPREDTTLALEYAQTKSEAAGIFLSTDGGMSFTQVSTNDSDAGEAWSVKGETRLFNRISLKGYYQWLGDDFSTTGTISQQAKALMGVSTIFDLGPQSRLSVRHDVQEVLDRGTPQADVQVGAQRTETTIVQIMHQIRKFKITGEFQNTNARDEINGVISETNTRGAQAALKGEYQLTDKTIVSLQHQAAVEGEDSSETTLGISTKPIDQVALHLKQGFGSQGSRTSLGMDVSVNDATKVSAGYSVLQGGEGEVQAQASSGINLKVAEDSQVHLKGAVSQTDKGIAQTITYGMQKQISEEEVVTSERSVTAGAGQLQDAQTYGIERTKKDGETVYSRLTTESTTSSGVEKTSEGLALGQDKDSQSSELIFSAEKEISDTNVASTRKIEGRKDITDQLSLALSLAKGDVQNYSGGQSERVAVATGLGYLLKDKSTEDVLTKAALKLEFRHDSGDDPRRHMLVKGDWEKRLSEDFTYNFGLDYSRDTNPDLDKILAEHREFTIGMAYRPLRSDQVNLLAQYTHQSDRSSDEQVSLVDSNKTEAHIVALDVIYDLNSRWMLTERLAFRREQESILGFGKTATDTWFLGQRVDYRMNKDWSVGLEYRRLAQRQARDAKQGFLTEVKRDVMGMGEVALGYNFTDFSDDLTSLDYSSKGPYIRLSGMLYNQSPEEIEQRRREQEDVFLQDMINQFIKEKDWLCPTGGDAQVWARGLIVRWLNLDKTFEDRHYVAKKSFQQNDIYRAEQIWKKLYDKVSLVMYEKNVMLDYFLNRFEYWKLKAKQHLSEIEVLKKTNSLEKKAIKRQARALQNIGDIKALFSLGRDNEAWALYKQTLRDIKDKTRRRKKEYKDTRVREKEDRKEKERQAKRNQMLTETQGIRNSPSIAMGDSLDLVKDFTLNPANITKLSKQEQKEINYLLREVKFFLRHHQYEEALDRLKKILTQDPFNKKAQSYYNQLKTKY